MTYKYLASIFFKNSIFRLLIVWHFLLIFNSFNVHQNLLFIHHLLHWLLYSWPLYPANLSMFINQFSSNFSLPIHDIFSCAPIPFYLHRIHPNHTLYTSAFLSQSSTCKFMFIPIALCFKLCAAITAFNVLHLFFCSSVGCCSFMCFFKAVFDQKYFVHTSSSYLILFALLWPSI